MCGRYAITTDPAKLAAEIDALNEVPELQESPHSDDNPERATSKTHPPGVNYNVAPTSSIMTVVERHDRDAPGDDATRRVRAMRWGLVPHWAKDVKKGPLLFNARAETAAEKSSFRSSVKSRRCLVPMDGWYEWRPGPIGENGKPTKIPYYMSPQDRTRLFMAGLWAVWRSPDEPGTADPVLSCSILTTDAVGELRDIHDRMPLIMPAEHWDSWLDPDSQAPGELFEPPTAELVDQIAIREVAPLVNRVANNGPELLNPV